MIHDLSLLNIATMTPETMTNNHLQNSSVSRGDACRGLTLSQSVEGTDGGGVRGDADFLLCHGALDVHCQSAVDVCVQIIHHSSGKRHIH